MSSAAGKDRKIYLKDLISQSFQESDQKILKEFLERISDAYGADDNITSEITRLVQRMTLKNLCSVSPISPPPYDSLISSDSLNSPLDVNLVKKNGDLQDQQDQIFQSIKDQVQHLNNCSERMKFFIGEIEFLQSDDDL